MNKKLLLLLVLAQLSFDSASAAQENTAKRLQRIATAQQEKQTIGTEQKTDDTTTPSSSGNIAVDYDDLSFFDTVLIKFNKVFIPSRNIGNLEGAITDVLGNILTDGYEEEKEAILEVFSLYKNFAEKKSSESFEQRLLAILQKAKTDESFLVVIKAIDNYFFTTYECIKPIQFKQQALNALFTHRNNQQQVFTIYRTCSFENERQAVLTDFPRLDRVLTDIFNQIAEAKKQGDWCNKNIYDCHKLDGDGNKNNNVVFKTHHNGVICCIGAHIGNSNDIYFFTIQKDHDNGEKFIATKKPKYIKNDKPAPIVSQKITTVPTFPAISKEEIKEATPNEVAPTQDRNASLFSAISDGDKKDGYTPLMVAAKNHASAEVTSLLQEYKEYAPLYDAFRVALENNATGCAKILFQSMFNLDKSTSFNSIVELGHTNSDAHSIIAQVVSILDPETLADWIFHVVSLNDSCMFELFLNAFKIGGGINRILKDGTTLLDFACAKALPGDFIYGLIKAGACYNNLKNTSQVVRIVQYVSVCALEHLIQHEIEMILASGGNIIARLHALFLGLNNPNLYFNCLKKIFNDYVPNKTSFFELLNKEIAKYKGDFAGIMTDIANEFSQQRNSKQKSHPKNKKTTRPAPKNQQEVTDKLFKALSNRDQTEFARLIPTPGIDINAQNRDGETLLFAATSYNLYESVKLLLNKGASTEVATDDGYTPLHVASHYGFSDIIKLLIVNGTDVTAQIDKGQTPLWIAAYRGNEKAVTLLLKNKHVDINMACTRSGVTPLFVAAQEGHPNIVRLLLKKGANVNTARTDNNATPLFIASQSGSAWIVTLLLHNGAEVNTSIIDGATPLHAASQRGHHETVGVLLEHGASINAQMKGGVTPLCMASQQGHVDVVKRLMHHGADITKGYETGAESLGIALQNNYVEIVTLLLGGKLPRNFVNLKYYASIISLRNTLHCYVQNNDIDKLSKALNSLDPNAPLTYYLLNYADENGNTALHIAAQNDTPEIFGLLVKSVAKSSIKNKEGRLPLDLVTNPERKKVFLAACFNKKQ